MEPYGPPFSFPYLDHLKALRAEIVKLPDIPVTDDLQPKDKIGATHLLRIRQDLSKLLYQAPLEMIPIRLKDYLNNLWLTIKHSRASYTSLPQTEVVSVLFKAATFVCECVNAARIQDSPYLTPLEVLMPDATLISNHNDYPHLKSMPVTWTEDNAVMLDKLSLKKSQLEKESITQEEEEKARWLKNEIQSLEYDLTNFGAEEAATGGKEAGTISQAAFSEKQLDENIPRSTQLEAIVKTLNEHKKAFKTLQKKAENKTTFNLLMSLEIKRAEYLRAKEYCDECDNYFLPKLSILWNALCQSITIERKGKTALVPLSVLLTENDALILPYSDYGEALTEEEWGRLINHSRATTALIEARKERYRYMHDPEHFLGQLSLFCDALRLNDAQEGFGTEEAAGEGAYSAIIVFSEYYQGLDDDEKSKIPAPLKKEIEYLLKIVMDWVINLKAGENMDTCISMRRREIQSLIPYYKLELSAIRCREQKLALLIQHADERVKEAEASLLLSLRGGAYKGRDRLDLTDALLKFVAFDLTFESFEEVHGLMTLTKQGMNKFIKGPKSIQNIVTLFDDPEHLVLFMHEYPTRQLNAFFSIVGEPLFQRLCCDMKDVTKILRSLPVEKIKLTLNEMKKYTTFPLKYGQILELFCHDLEKVMAVLEIFDEKIHLDALTEINPSKSTALHIAAYHNDRVFFKLLERYPTFAQQKDAISLQDKVLNTLLHYAAYNPDVCIQLLDTYYKTEAELLTVLKQKNIDADSSFVGMMMNPNTIQWLKKRLSLEKILMLLAMKNHCNRTALHIAARDLAAIKLLLNCYPDERTRLAVIEQKDSLGRNVLYYAAVNNVDVFSFLLNLYTPGEQRLIALNTKDAEDRTLFQKAIQDKSIEDRSSFQKPINYAARIDALCQALTRQEFMQELMKKNADDASMIDATFSSLNALEYIFSKLQYHEHVMLMKDKNTKGQTFLHRAVDNLDVITCVMKKFIPKRQQAFILDETNEGDTVLHRARNYDCFCFLLGRFDPEERFFALEKKNKGGNTVLHTLIDQWDIMQNLAFQISPIVWQQLLLIENNDKNTVMHLAAHNHPLLELCIFPLDMKDRIEVLNAKNRDGDTVWYCITNPKFLHSIIDRILPEQRLAIINAKNSMDQTLIHRWGLGQLKSKHPKEVYRIIRLLPKPQRLAAMLAENSLGMSLIKKAIFDLRMETIEQLQQLLEVLVYEDQMKVIKEPINGISVADQMMHHPELIPVLLGYFQSKDAAQFLIDTKCLNYESMEVICGENTPYLLERIFKMIAIDSRYPVITKKTMGSLNFFDVKNCESMKLLFKALPPDLRLKAIREKDERKDCGVLYAMRKQPKMIQVILNSLSSEERLAVMHDPDPYNLCKQSTLLETIAEENTVVDFQAIMLLMADYQSLDAHVFEVLESKLSGHLDHAFIRHFYAQIIQSFQDSKNQPTNAYASLSSVFAPTEKTKTLKKILAAMYERKDTFLSPENKRVIAAIPLLKQVIESYERMSHVCILKERSFNEREAPQGSQTFRRTRSVG